MGALSTVVVTRGSRSPEFERLIEWTKRRASVVGIDLSTLAAERISQHAQAVMHADPSLHLTAIRDPVEFLERHIGESLEGVSLLPPGIDGALLDLGSGNGYPGVPVAIAVPGLRAHLVEASARKAAFLDELVREILPGGTVIHRQVQRSSDIGEYPTFRVITMRAVGGWERILPRIASRLASDGRILLWVGETAHAVFDRAAWRNLTVGRRRALPGREVASIVEIIEI